MTHILHMLLRWPYVHVHLDASLNHPYESRLHYIRVHAVCMCNVYTCMLYSLKLWPFWTQSPYFWYSMNRYPLSLYTSPAYGNKNTNKHVLESSQCTCVLHIHFLTRMYMYIHCTYTCSTDQWYVRAVASLCIVLKLSLSSVTLSPVRWSTKIKQEAKEQTCYSFIVKGERDRAYCSGAYPFLSQWCLSYPRSYRSLDRERDLLRPYPR